MFKILDLVTQTESNQIESIVSDSFSQANDSLVHPPMLCLGSPGARLYNAIKARWCQGPPGHPCLCKEITYYIIYCKIQYYIL